MKEKPIQENFNIENYGKIKVYLQTGAEVAWKEFLPYLEDTEPTPDLRRTKREQRKIFVHTCDNGKIYYIKKLSYKNSKRFRDIFRGFIWYSSRALKQLTGIMSLNRAGLRTPDPVAVIEEKYGLLKKQGLIIMDECKGEKLKDKLESNIEINKKFQLIKKGYMEIKRMHRLGITHGDTNVGNIFVTRDDKFIWFDFDRFKTSKLYLILKGKFYDIELFMQSSIISLIKSGDWDKNVKKKYMDMFNTAYPGSNLIKKLVIKSNAGKIEGF